MAGKRVENAYAGIEVNGRWAWSPEPSANEREAAQKALEWARIRGGNTKAYVQVREEYDHGGFIVTGRPIRTYRVRSQTEFPAAKPGRWDGNIWTEDD
jgi:hypothetical protein